MLFSPMLWDVSQPCTTRCLAEYYFFFALWCILELVSWNSVVNFSAAPWLPFNKCLCVCSFLFLCMSSYAFLSLILIFISVVPSGFMILLFHQHIWWFFFMWSFRVFHIYMIYWICPLGFWFCLGGVLFVFFKLSSALHLLFFSGQ